MSKKTVLGVFVVLGAVFGIAWAKGDWSSAQSKAEDLKRRQQDLRRLVPDEVRRIVTAVCEVDEDARRDAGRDSADRVASKVGSELSNLERARDDAFRALDEVLGDQELKDRHDTAKRLRDEVAEQWKSIEKMARNAMRGGNHPVVSWMAQKGVEEHRRYQESTSNCHAYEVEVGGRRADCLRADGDTCYVIELKPKNSRAISNGNQQVRYYRDELTRELEKMLKGESSRVMQDLIGKRSDFAKCKRFEQRLRCYTLCPEVDSEGEFREPSVRWEDC